MTDPINTLPAYISENSIEAEYLQFQESCHSVAQAAAAAGANTDEFVKNICLLGPQNELAVAIVRGVDRVCTKKAARLLNLKRVRLATATEILEHTGFPCGGTPSFGFHAHFIIDRHVMELPVVYSGGGTETSLVKTTPAVILEASQGQIADITRE